MKPKRLELRDATVVKNDRRILDGLTLTIEAGEHTAIIGPNGAGKSALVSLLTHDDRPVRHAKAKSNTAAPEKTPRAPTETEAASACDVPTPEAASAAVPAPA